jgi:flagellar hook-basal body complex protein FliE
MSAPIGAASGNALNLAAALREETRTDIRLGGEPGVGPTDAASRGVHEAGGFGAILEKTLGSANAKAQEAASKAQALADGRTDDLHGTMITMKEAEISMKLVGGVRDKLLDAFHELWRINV